MRSQDPVYSPAPTSDEDEKKQRSPKQARKRQLLKPFLALIVIFVSATVLATSFLGIEIKSFWMPDISGSVESVQVKKSPYDSRSYKFFALPNGLQVLAVSDPTADRCAASMDVSVGHFSDPEDFPGLAHFLEHMLFMGSKKYPDENYYSAYLAQHGGSSNAFTATENTNYHFDITPEFYEGALDVFAQFFVSPLLREGSTEREVNAVQNEHIKNLQVDGWRAQQLRKHLSNPRHPMHKFGTGNMQTLCNGTKTGTPASHCHKTRKALKEFYDTHYNARRMRLVVSCKMDVRTLQKQVRDRFSNVPVKGAHQPEQWDMPVKAPGTGSRIIEYVPIKDSRVVSITWSLPPLFQFFKCKAGSYISHLLGHEAQGSVAALLKKEGLIESLSAGGDTNNRYGAEFEISVSLTEKGQKHIYEVLDYIFQYLRLIKRSGALEWVWKESADLAAMHFRFQEKSDPAGYVVGLASNLQLYPPDRVISAPYDYETFDPQIIKWVMDYLKPEKADIFMCSKVFVPSASLKEPIYGTQYNVFSAANTTLWKWNNAPIDSRLSIVKPNKFIPKNFTLIGKKAPSDSNPIKLVDKVGARLWFKQDRDFQGKNWVPKPKLSAMFQITSPFTDSSASASVMTTLFTMLYMDAMLETTYDAQAAGLGWSLSTSDDGLLLRVSGYNDKLFLLLKQVVEPMVACLRRNSQCSWASAQRFENIKDELKRGLENSKKSPPYTKAIEKVQHLLKKRAWSVDRLLYELSLSTMNLDTMAEHVKNIFSRVYIEGLVHGNCDPLQARRMLEEIAIALGSYPLPEEERDLQQVVKLESGMVYAEAHSNPEDLNHAIELYYQTPKRGIEVDVKTALLGAMASEPCFDQLRTKEQLGYLVACRAKPIAATYPPVVNGFAVLIQSSFKDPSQLDLSARRFVDGFVANMSSMPQTKFEAHKSALLAQIEEKEVTIAQETSRLWGEIIKKRYEWSRRKHLVQALKDISLAQMGKFAQEMINLSAHSLSVWIYGKAMDVPDDRQIQMQGDSRERISSVTDFKRKPPHYFPIETPKSVSG